MKSVCSPPFIANPSCLLVQLRGVSHLIVYLASMYVGVLQFHMLLGQAPRITTIHLPAV